MYVYVCVFVHIHSFIHSLIGCSESARANGAARASAKEAPAMITGSGLELRVVPRGHQQNVGPCNDLVLKLRSESYMRANFAVVSSR